MSEGTPSEIVRLLELETLDEDTFLATEFHLADPGRRLFGGLVAARSLRAACHTVGDGRHPHSLHAYFIRPGTYAEPLRFEVARTRDGRAFSTRHVTAAQGGKPIFEMIASFHDPEPGFDWQRPGPADVPPPEELPPPDFPAFTRHPDGFEMRSVRRTRPDGIRSVHPFWIRHRTPLEDDPAQHACLIAWLSDMAVVTGARAPWSPRELAMGVSLDHALWFHRPARIDDWLLFSVEAASNSGARGLAHGTLHTRDGVLVASIAQEALLRPQT
jgi:acyl-CoA thioesterase-2